MYILTLIITSGLHSLLCKNIALVVPTIYDVVSLFVSISIC